MNLVDTPHHLQGMEEKIHLMYLYLHLTNFCIVHVYTNMTFARFDNHSITQVDPQIHM
jgi:hypothetical protein